MFFRSRAPRVNPEDLEPMPAGLVFYTASTCPYCVRVQRVVDELGVELTVRNRNLQSQWRQVLLARTGRTQVPCLFIEGEPLFESADIITWLRRNYD